MSDCKKINCPICNFEVEDTFVEQKCPRCQSIIESSMVCGSCNNCHETATGDKGNFISKIFSLFKN